MVDTTVREGTMKSLHLRHYILVQSDMRNYCRKHRLCINYSSSSMPTRLGFAKDGLASYTAMPSPCWA
jgi:hypothetical protein